MNVYIDNKQVTGKLADVLAVVFGPQSAKAAVSGENRAMAAASLARALPQLGQFSTITLDDSDGTATIKAENMTEVLGKISEACTRWEEVKNALASHEAAYDGIRSYVAKNPSDGKRGRKAANLEEKYDLGAIAL